MRKGTNFLDRASIIRYNEGEATKYEYVLGYIGESATLLSTCMIGLHRRFLDDLQDKKI